jgi:hypothetical protein
MPARRPLPWQQPPRAWYQLERWRRIRRAHLRAEPLCRMCLANNRVVPATIVDHIEPHNGNWNKFLTSPRQSLCEHCHNSDKRFVDLNGHAKVIFGSDGWPIEQQILIEQSTNKPVDLNWLDRHVKGDLPPSSS